MNASAVATVLDMARQVADPRRHNKLHPLPAMIVMSLIAILCGCDGWDEVAEYCQDRKVFFRQLLSLRRGIPSHDTFGRVFARLDPDQLEKMLRAWMAALNIVSGGKLIALDGKSLRRSFEHSWNKHAMSHIVSAFVTENKVVLAQLGVNDKENEITAIPKLLAMLDLEDATVTIDPIGCQREIAEQITAAKGHFVLQVKDNQPKLLEKVKKILDEAILEQLKGWRGSTFTDLDAGHGRIESRQVWITTEVEHLGKDLLELWPGVKAVVAVDNTREVIGSGKPASTQRHYYILSDGQCTAERAGQIIRGHWGIENSLHYVLDVSFDEDHCRVRTGNGAENFSRLRRLTANLLQLNQSKRSIKSQRKRCGWNEDYLFKTLFNGLKPTPQ
jgi:predicted transposase YbfD/YdcC